MFYLFLVTYGTIFVSELIGDKNIYTISSLATRFRPSQVFCGFTLAFAIKTLVAILLGSMIAELPTSLVATTSTVTFFLTALVIWFKRSSNIAVEREYDSHSSKAVLVPFAAVLFSEWGDIGQIMAATLTARYQAPFVVFLGGTLALVTKGVLALVIGFSLRRRVPISVLRPVSACLCVIMGVISAVSPIFTSPESH
ncbi:MAG TPA: TMEM165/GDT1 family protein [Pyrinomonadaceae bacterium]|nr:TMEM165/GDT1 family protein [Pyrinomonadaceae bacterium]